MITSLAQNIAIFLTENDIIDNKNLDIYIYGFEVMISNALNILIAAALGFAFSQILKMVVFF